MTSLLDQPELLGGLIAGGRSRAIAAGVDPNQYDAITTGLSSVSQWSSAFRAAGAEHRSQAEAAERAGHFVSAADAYLAAAACAHVATTLPTPDRAGHQEAAAAMHRALALLDPPVHHLRGQMFRGVLAPQPGDPSAPVVVIVPGLDSSQVEFHANAVALHRRGLATLTIDGPGQGEMAPETAMRADYDVVITEVLDALRDTGIQPAATGILALSLGGFFGALGLAREPRLTAGVIVSGPSRLLWDELPELVKATLTLRAGDQDAARGLVAHINVDDIAPTPGQPLLVIDGQLDVIPGVTNGERLATLAPHGQHLLIPGGDHLIGNRRWQWLPRAADFLHDQLTSEAAAAAEK